MLKKALVLLAVLLGACALAIWLLQRSGEKILYLDAKHQPLSVKMAEVLNQCGGYGGFSGGVYVLQG